jgi:hypothetical protein
MSYHNYIELKQKATKIKQTIPLMDYLFGLEKRGILKYEGKIGKEHFFGLLLQRTGSISVKEDSNLWFDHSSGKGGDIIEAVMFFENVSFSVAVNSFGNNNPIESSLVRKENSNQHQYEITNVGDIINSNLKAYISTRALDFNLVKMYCNQVNWRVGEKFYYGIGWKNDKGGWAVRSQVFKGNLVCSGLSTINLGSCRSIKIFEGMFDFISYLQFKPNASDFRAIVLNSTANLTTSFINELKNSDLSPIELYLDNDQEGDTKTAIVLLELPNSVDCRDFFEGFEDLNAKLIKHTFI